MKKTLLAVSIASLFATTTAQAVTVYDTDGQNLNVYGRAQFNIMDPGGVEANGDSKDITGVGSARFGLKGSSEITSGLKVLAHGEWQLDAENSNKGNEIVARHVYLGVSDDVAGRLVFGQTDTAFYQAVAATDIFNSYGYAAFNKIEDGRQEGQVVYNGLFNNVYVGASYQLSDNDYQVSMGNPSTSLPNKTGMKLDSAYGLTLGYQFGFGLDIYAGYQDENLANDTATNAEGTKTNLALSAGYTIADLYLGAAVVQAEYSGDTLQTAGGVALIDDAKLFGYDFVAKYTILDDIAVYGGYAVQEAKGSISQDEKLANEFTLGTQYMLTNNAKVWGEYKIDSVDGNDNVWQIAAQYNF